MLTFTGCVSLVLPSAFSIGLLGADAEVRQLLPGRQDREALVLDADDATELRDDSTAACGHGVERPPQPHGDDHPHGDDAVARPLQVVHYMTPLPANDVIGHDATSRTRRGSSFLRLRSKAKGTVRLSDGEIRRPERSGEPTTRRAVALARARGQSSLAAGAWRGAQPRLHGRSASPSQRSSRAKDSTGSRRSRVNTRFGRPSGTVAASANDSGSPSRRRISDSSGAR
jgi:hypothetical protein